MNEFSNLIKNFLNDNITIFNSFPAHIAVNMVGLNFSDMKLFENLYFEYLEKIKSQNFENKNTLLNLSNGILNLISK